MRTVPAPEWLVWQIFYERLGRQAHDSAEGVQQLLANKLELRSGETDVLLSLGKNYIDEISRLITSEKNQVSELASALVEPNKQDRKSRSINEILERDGALQRFDAKKNFALEGHKRRLAHRIGTKKLGKLERWLQAEVGKQLRVIKVDRAASTKAAQAQ